MKPSKSKNLDCPDFSKLPDGMVGRLELTRAKIAAMFIDEPPWTEEMEKAAICGGGKTLTMAKLNGAKIPDGFGGESE